MGVPGFHGLQRTAHRLLISSTTSRRPRSPDLAARARSRRSNPWIRPSLCPDRSAPPETALQRLGRADPRWVTPLTGTMNREDAGRRRGGPGRIQPLTGGGQAAVAAVAPRSVVGSRDVCLARRRCRSASSATARKSTPRARTRTACGCVGGATGPGRVGRTGCRSRKLSTTRTAPKMSCARGGTDVE